MRTVRFWRALDRLGTDGASRLHWQRELGDEFEAAAPYLRRMPGTAGRVPDPDDPRGLISLEVYPQADAYVGVSDEAPSHRPPLELSADDVSLLAPDWEAIRPAIAELLGFTPLSTTVQQSGIVRQVGISQPEIGCVVPVFLYLPHGSFSDPQLLTTNLHQLAPGILYVPTRRHLIAEIFSIANPRNILVESVADRIAAQVTPATTTLTVAAMGSAAPASRPKKAAPILAAQPGRTWEKLTIRLTESGTLVARYGGQPGEYRFGRKIGPDGRPKYPLLFQILFRMCADGRWKNPARTERNYGATQRAFARLRELLQTLTLIEGDPFRKVSGGWEPRFQFQPDPEFAKAIELHRSKGDRIPQRSASRGRAGEENDEADEF